MAGYGRRRRRRGGVALPRRARQRSGVVLVVRPRGARVGGARPRHERTRALGFGGHAAGCRAGDARQRTARRRPGCRPRPRRLPCHRSPRHSGRGDLPPRPPARARAPRADEPGRSAAAVGAPASARRTGGDQSRRSALHRRGGCGVPERRDGPRADGGRHRDVGSAHRRLDRRAAARGAVDARAGRRRGLHCRLRRRRSLHRRLPGGRGAATPARIRAAVHAADVGPRPPRRDRCATRSRVQREARRRSKRWIGRTCS